jgi:hypothetical protein
MSVEPTPDVVNRFRFELEAEGVGRTSIRKALVLLPGVLHATAAMERASRVGCLPCQPADGGCRAPAGKRGAAGLT